MRISFRIIIVIFFTLAIILFGSGFAFYSIMYKVVTNQQTNRIRELALNVSYEVNSSLQDCDRSFETVYQKNKALFLDSTAVPSQNHLDFILRINHLDKKHYDIVFRRSWIKSDSAADDVFKFLQINNIPIVRNFISTNNDSYFYGFRFRNNEQDSLAGKLGVNIAVFQDGTNILLTKAATSARYLFLVLDAYKQLSFRKDNNLFFREDDDIVFLASAYHMQEPSYAGRQLTFIIFSAGTEAAELRSTLNEILILLIGVSLLLSVILSTALTTKMRRQISNLMSATEFTRSGNLHMRIEVSSKDEIGKLADAYNNMLGALQQQEEQKKHITDLLTAMNENPDYHIFAPVVLEILRTSTSSEYGVIYIVNNDVIEAVFHCGDGVIAEISSANDTIFKQLKDEKSYISFIRESAEHASSAFFDRNECVEVLFISILSGTQLIAILQMGSHYRFESALIDYLMKVREHLAIGITKAMAYTQLEKTVAELARQKKKAEESTEMKSRFVATISHELRTPLNSILGLTEVLLRDKSLTDKMRERMSVINRSGVRLLGLINEVLDLSKIESGKNDLMHAVFPLTELINELINAFTPLADRNGLQFVVTNTLHPDILIESDKDRLHQILDNLIGNAVKFTKEGGVFVNVTLKADVELVFEVQDTGIGINEQNLPLIFEEFRQVDSSSTRSFGGTGLGLAIVKKLVELFGGTISVKSEEGHGSLFVIAIPVKIVENMQGKLSEYISTGMKRAKIDRLCLAIAFPENIQSILKNELSGKGIETIFCDSADTIDVFQSKPPDIVLYNASKTEHLDFIHNLSIYPNRQINCPVFIAYMTDQDNDDQEIAFSPQIRLIANQEEAEIYVNEIFTDLDIREVYIIIDDESIFPSELTSGKKVIVKNLLKDDLSDIAENAHIVLFIKNSENYPSLSILSEPHLNVDISILLLNQENQINAFLNSLVIKQCSRSVKLEGKVDALMLNSAPYLRDIPSLKELEADHLNRKVGAIHSAQSVLIVDDDSDSLFTMNEIMKEYHLSTLLAKNGIECIEILENQIPDLILLDIMMPKMDGYQTIQAIRNRQEWSSIPVLAVTAKVFPDDRALLYRSGFDGIVQKPIVSDILAYKVLQLLRK